MLNALLRYNHITNEEHEQILDAYLFLREIENILRVVNNYSSEKLPDNDKEFNMLLNRINIEDKTKDGFHYKYNLVSFTIREIYYRYLGN